MKDSIGSEKRTVNTPLLTRLGLFTAIAVALSFVPGISIIPAVSFIKYEFSDLPILIATFAFGTLPGIAVTFMSILISFLLSIEDGPYGSIMHFLAIGSYVLAAGLIYRRKKTMGGAIIGMIAGIIAMTAVMIPANLIITPFYMGVPAALVRPLIVPAIIPVNLIKGAITAVLTFVSYKRIKSLLFRGKTLDGSKQTT